MICEKHFLYEDRADVFLTTYLWEPSPSLPAGEMRPLVLVCPGGGYLNCSDREAEPVALRFAAMGYQAAVLRYSTYGERRDDFARLGTDDYVKPHVLYPAQMMANLNKTRGMLFSSKVLLALVDTGITREDAYKVVQSNAMAVWADIQQGIAGPSFRERLEADPACTLGAEQLDAIFDPRSFLTRSGIMFDRLETLTFD